MKLRLSESNYTEELQDAIFAYTAYIKNIDIAGYSRAVVYLTK